MPNPDTRMPNLDPKHPPRQHDQKVDPNKRKKPDEMPGDGNQDVLPGQHGNDSVPGHKKHDDRLKQ